MNSWRKIKEDEVGSVTYVSGSNTFISVYKTKDGWAYHTPKSRGVTTKSRAKRIIKLYMKKHRA